MGEAKRIHIQKEGFKIKIDDNRFVEAYACDDFSIAYRLVNGAAVTELRITREAVDAMFVLKKTIGD